MKSVTPSFVIAKEASSSAAHMKTWLRKVPRDNLVHFMHSVGSACVRMNVCKQQRGRTHAWVINNLDHTLLPSSLNVDKMKSRQQVSISERAHPALKRRCLDGHTHTLRKLRRTVDACASTWPPMGFLGSWTNVIPPEGSAITCMHAGSCNQTQKRAWTEAASTLPGSPSAPVHAGVGRIKTRSMASRHALATVGSECSLEHYLRCTQWL